MIIVDERTVREIVSMADVIDAVRRALVADDAGEAENFAVVRTATGHRSAVFGIKSGQDRSKGVLGLKAGGYWPENAKAGLPNHQSTILLFDPESGQPAALVAAGYLTALRTAAASALAAGALARTNARVMAIVGAGDQAPFQVEAIRMLLPIERVLVANRSRPRADELLRRLAEAGLDAAVAEPDEAVAAADVVVTVTPARTPLFPKSAVRPGTHISAMGADTAGKQELDSDLVAEAAVYTDSIDQALTIGECQHAHASGHLAREGIRGTLGGLLSGRVPGRSSDAEITLFDGTGVALQDLAAGALAIDLARRAGRALEVDL